MELVIYIYFFLIGIVFGSFYNVVGLRVPVGESISRPRSHCPSCKRTLTAFDLVPVFSFLWLKGKCRHCQHKISPIYPLIEFATGLLFVFSYWKIGFDWELLVALLLISMCVIIVVSDSRYMLIPNKILLFFAPLFILLRLFVSPQIPWWDILLGAVVGFGLLLLIAVISRGGMGGGDIKLFALLGLILGLTDVLLAFFLSTVFGTFFGVIGLLLKKVKRGKPMPFGPYIVLGTIVTYFYGESILQWYIQWL